MSNVEVSGLRGFLRRSARLPGWAVYVWVPSESLVSLRTCRTCLRNDDFIDNCQYGLYALRRYTDLPSRKLA